MKFSFLFVLLFLSVALSAQQTELDKDKIEAIKNVIALFQEKDVDKISSIVRFPLSREYPLHPINNKKELKQRFEQVFDENLINKIANSTVDQWAEVGWRGIMFDNGELWMADSDGIITSVNYQGALERTLISELIAAEKGSIHQSLVNYEKPVYKIETKSFLIRIDQLNDMEYRYASWKKGRKDSSLPDLVLKNGIWEPQGSGGNHVIEFVNKNYTYKIFRYIIGGEEASDVTLVVEKDGKVILTQDGFLVTDKVE